VDEVALGGGRGVVVLEEPDLVAHAAAAQAGDAQAGVDLVGEGDRGEVPALRLDHEPITGLFSMSRTPERIRYSFTTVSKYE
jgi:hypothetical protein